MRLFHYSLRAFLAIGLAIGLAACGGDRDPVANSTTASVEEASSSTSLNEAGINSSAQKLFGGEPPILVRESPIQGLAEVHMSNGVFYSSPDGKYFMQGDMIEVDTMQSLTQAARNESEGKRAEARAQVLQDFLNSGGADTAITYKADDEQFELYVFTDFTCPYCAQFHKDLEDNLAAGVTVHYFAWPRSGPESDTAEAMSDAWCAKDQKKAIDDLFDGKKVAQADCDSPVADHFQLGRDMMVSGTPAVFSADGQQFGGYMPQENLIQALNATYNRDPQ